MKNTELSFALKLASFVGAVWVTLVAAAVGQATSPSEPEENGRGPIIDMHLHAFGFDEYGDPPPPNEITGESPKARTDGEALAAALAEMDRHGIVKAVASGPLEHVLSWQRAAPDRILGGAYLGPRDTLPEVPRLRELFGSADLSVLGELGLQYRGLAPADESLRAYFALAEELDVPVAIHTGLGDAGTPYGCCPKFRVTLGRPSLVEDVLVRHPRLRVYLMHAGYPYLEETKALLYVYPQLYVDVAVINWALPRAEFHTYLRALVEAGFSERILFGSDQMIWPEAIGMAIEGVESASFLTPEQKQAVFYDNAARFLRLLPEEIQRHHREAAEIATKLRDGGGLLAGAARRHGGSGSGAKAVFKRAPTPTSSFSILTSSSTARRSSSP